MKIATIHTSEMHTNTYIVINNGRSFVVDVGGSAEEVIKIVNENGATLEAILLTHAHFDHIGGVKRLLDIAGENGHSDVSVFLHKDDVDKINSYKNMGFALGVKVEPFVPDILLSGGETITVAGIKIKVIHTPGHTKGGVCYVAEDNIFAGDTLFFSSYGRTDFYDGSLSEMKNSILNKLFRLKGNFNVLCGHGEPTTLDFERKMNAILSDDKFTVAD